MIRRWLALTYYLYALRLAALSYFYWGLGSKITQYSDKLLKWLFLSKNKLDQRIKLLSSPY